ncbi:MAG: glycerophosphodiester phosphodiesterase [Promethearchaeota archaeon]|nr:MAG: glycerophosphodiester phosphodiesterase [Candidatus Lokiarchaeota archaeon]
MIFIGHRGFRVGVLENTFDAFLKTVQLIMDFIECDVQLSRDGIPFILHDATLERTMGRPDRISDLTSEEISLIRSPVTDWTLPSLQNVLEFRKTHHHGAPKLILELKGKESGLKTAQLVQKLGSEADVVFSGRYLEELTAAHTLCPNIPLCLNITKCPSFSLDSLQKISTYSELPLPFRMISLKSTAPQFQEFVDKCHQIGALALVWHFMDDPVPVTSMMKFMEMGVDGILFDDPDTVSPFRKVLTNAQTRETY